MKRVKSDPAPETTRFKQFMTDPKKFTLPQRNPDTTALLTDSWIVGLHDIWVDNVSTLPWTLVPCRSNSLVFEFACFAFPPLASLFHRKPPPRSAARAGEETERALILPRLETSSNDLLAEATASGLIGVRSARSSDIDGEEAPQGRDMCTMGIICFL